DVLREHLCFKRIFPFEAKMLPQDIYTGSLLACAEMIRSGTVAFSDMYYCGKQLFAAAKESGLKANISLSVTNFTSCDPHSLPVFIESQNMPVSDGGVKLEYSIHAEYTSDERTVRTVAEAAKERGVGMHIHLSETKDEHEACIARHKMTPAAYFSKCGAFDVPATAAHCVWIDENDRSIMASHGATAAVNVLSNLKLASGFCDVGALMRSNVRFGLGTDGAASNNTLDMFREMRALASVYKCAFSDPTLVTPQQALRAATLSGAQAQRRNGGSVEAGKDADLIVLDVSGERYYPSHDIVTDLVFSSDSSDVVLNMTGGRILYENGEFLTVDIEKVKYEAKRSKEDILCRL
ncbi:MAG TPA: amidohydrolase family protein, partial [Bacillota bacterium]|nr:amidohydrolase family protein [Bacillota bacterium]